MGRRIAERGGSPSPGDVLGRIVAVVLLVASLAVVATAVGVATPAGTAHGGASVQCRLDGTANPNPFGALTGVPNPALGLPSSTGTLKALMLFVDFSDAPSSNTLPDTPASLETKLVDTAKHWQAEVSYGRFAIDVTTPLLSWIRMPHASTYYQLQDGMTFYEQRDYMQAAVNASGLPASAFSGVQLLYIVASRYSAVPNSPAFVGGSGNGITTPGGVIPAGATFGQDIWALPDPYGAWILAHETEHDLGLPDLYSFGNLADYDATHQYNGGWDHMDAIVLGSHIHAWEKLQLGWLDASQVPCVAGAGGTYTLTPLETPGGVKAVAIRTSATRVIVAENRQEIGHDAPLCDHGLLVYSVDASVASGSGPVRVQSGSAEVAHSPGFNACGRLYNAPFDTGRAGKSDTFSDSVSGLTIKVTADVGDNLNITVTVPNPYLPSTPPSSTVGTGPLPGIGQPATVNRPAVRIGP